VILATIDARAARFATDTPADRQADPARRLFEVGCRPPARVDRENPAGTMVLSRTFPRFGG
jgi:hypothetical protein